MNTKKSSTQDVREILIVEDSPTQAKRLRYLLEERNYKILEARNGTQALAVLDEHEPSLVITDIVMPQMNGYELCKKIKSRESNNDIPVILLTSLSNSEDVLEGLESGADNFITKPYSEEYLVLQVEQIIANREIQKHERVRVEVEIMFAGKRRFITADQQQMLTLLISTYEAAVRKNSELIQTQEELRSLNERLESLVTVRTAALATELEERRRAVEALRQSEREYRGVVENSLVGVYITNLKGDILFVNEAARKIYEFDSIQEMISGGAVARYKNTKDRDIFIENLKQTGKVESFEIEVLTKTGKTRTVIISATLTGDVLQGMVLDITERTRAVEALTASEVRYRRLFEAARDGILILDGDTGMVNAVNPFLIELLGYSREQFLGKKIWELGSFRDIAANKSHLDELLRKEFIQYEDVPLETAEGRLINVEFVSHVYRVDRHKVIQCNIRDITKRKQAEEKILHQLEELRRWQEVTLGREDRNQQLKREVNELLIRLGEPIRYPSQENDVAKDRHNEVL